jgi:hypothetical protein
MKKITAAVSALIVAGMLFVGCDAAKNKPEDTTGNISNTSSSTTPLLTLEGHEYTTSTTPMNPTVTRLESQPDAVSEPEDAGF